jgi:hypothetical protein
MLAQQYIIPNSCYSVLFYSQHLPTNLVVGLVGCKWYLTFAWRPLVFDVAVAMLYHELCYSELQCTGNTYGADPSIDWLLCNPMLTTLDTYTYSSCS